LIDNFIIVNSNPNKIFNKFKLIYKMVESLSD